MPDDSRATGTGAPVGTTGFVREATGLVRELGLIDAIAINLFAAGPVSGVFVPILMGSLFPGASIYGVLTIGAFFGIFNGLVYAYLSGAMPRAGGDYVYNGRILHPAIGFMSSWGFTISQFLILAIAANLLLTTILSQAFYTIGIQANNSALENLGSVIVATPLNIWLVGVLVLLIVMLIVILPVHWFRRVISTALIVGLIGGLATPLVLLSYSHGGFVQAFDSFMLKQTSTPDAYNSIISTAQSLGFSEGGNSLAEAVLAIPIGYFIFVGFTWSSYAAGEIKNAAKTQVRAVEISLLIAWVYLMVMLGQYYNLVGSLFNDSAVYLANNDPSKYPIPVAPSVSFFAGILSPDIIVNIVMQAAIILFLIFSLVAIALVCVRSIFAWSFDRAFPAVFASVTSRGSPWVATLLTGVGSVLLLAVYEFTTFFTLTVNYTVIFSVVFFITSFSAILFPFRRKDLFGNAPAMVRQTVGGVPVLSIFGFIQLILFGAILYTSFILPAFSGPTGPLAIGFLVGIYVTGFLAFWIAWAYRKRSGTDLTLLHREIPPE